MFSGKATKIFRHVVHPENLFQNIICTNDQESLLFFLKKRKKRNDALHPNFKYGDNTVVVGDNAFGDVFGFSN